MSKRDFEAIAARLRMYSEHNLARAIARELATYFASVNPRFDNRRFLIACGIDPRDI